MEPAGYCSWCRRLCPQRLIEPGGLFSRPVYACVGCANRTLPCREDCGAFSQGGSLWDDEYCSVCGGELFFWPGETVWVPIRTVPVQYDDVSQRGYIPTAVAVSEAEERRFQRRRAQKKNIAGMNADVNQAFQRSTLLSSLLDQPSVDTDLCAQVAETCEEMVKEIQLDIEIIQTVECGDDARASTLESLLHSNDLLTSSLSKHARLISPSANTATEDESGSPLTNASSAHETHQMAKTAAPIGVTEAEAKQDIGTVFGL